MRKLVLLLVALLPVSVASATSPGSPLVLLSGTTSQGGEDVVVQRVDGTGQVSLSGGAGHSGTPAWSPDGSKVAFRSNAATNGSGPGELYVADADGRDLHAVTQATPAGAFRFSPTWSPDGLELAYLERSTSSGPADIWMVRAAGGTPHRLTSDGGDKQSVAWQPRGSLLLFDRIEPVGGATLWTVDVAGGVEHQIGDRVSSVGGTAAYWSPDGARLAFPGRSGKLAVSAADGSGLHDLTSMNIVGAPAWSPTGGSIAFAGLHVLPGKIDRYGPPTAIDIFVADSVTGAARRLTGPFDGGSAGSRNDVPSWWPDGSRVLFRSDGYDGLDRVRQMNADGTCQVPVPLAINVPLELAFQPGVAAPVGAARCVDLRVRATTVDGAVAPRRPATVSVVVENGGNEPATGVELTITSAGRAIGFVQGADLGTLAPGEERTVTATLSSPAVGLATAVVAATADEVDPTPTNARASAATSVLNCTVVGTWGADSLFGTPGRDRICGLPGPDRIDGGKGNDYLDAGSGNDTIIGGPGRDTIIARGGRDVIDARDGQLDWIDCGTEYDIAIVDRIDHTSHCEKVLRR